ncbi:SDR family NAD(P)-dependent oxidoreductase [Rhodoligotrophos defluvii]|uniref:SDR family NAD(P)-dependent oxidoreductase n=1 Tax=Rhodoligotrophos defluvii TaxID=2561934 RepID=UPI0010C99922|nr:SDR family oxidoreductase [Rhodoligotrophos defluvii]
MRGLHEKVFIVTGAGSGIGRASALRLAEEGAFVLAVDRDIDKATETVGLSQGATGKVQAFAQDLTENQAPQAILQAARDAFGELDGLVNNVGLGSPKSALDEPDEEHDKYMNINFRTVFRMSRDFIGFNMHRGGSIVSIASTFGLVGFPGAATYSAAKAAIVGLTRQLAAEYGEHGFRVNAVAPGLIMTPAHTLERQTKNKWFYDSYLNGTPLKVAGDADAIGAAVTFLSSADAGFITGQVLPVDGGWTITKYAFADDGRVRAR